MLLLLVEKKTCLHHGLSKFSFWSFFSPRFRMRMEKVSAPHSECQFASDRCPWCWRFPLFSESERVYWKAAITSSGRSRLDYLSSASTGWHWLDICGSHFGSRKRRKQTLRLKSWKRHLKVRDIQILHKVVLSKIHEYVFKNEVITHKFEFFGGSSHVSRWAPRCQPFPVCASESEKRDYTLLKLFS